MAKMKSGGQQDGRSNKEMRDIEVEFDFTPNALASILYKQGNTMVLATLPLTRDCRGGFPKCDSRLDPC